MLNAFRLPSPFIFRSRISFSPLALFAGGEQGAWFDPSDLTTLFQDTAGTTPVTTPGQTVALVLDKSGRGNHATQPTASARPVYGRHPVTGRRNLLLATDTMSTQSVTVAAVARTLAFTGTGTVTLSGASTAGPLVGTGVSNRVSLNFTPTAGSLTLTVSGSVTLAQLELGSTATAYQRVVSAFDVTEVGVASLHYLGFDGVDDGMVTPTITPGTDKVQVFAGVRRLTSARGVICALPVSGNGYVELQTNITLGSNYEFASTGTIRRTLAPTVDAAPTTHVVTQISSISEDVLIGRVNGAQVASTSGDQGTGDYLANVFSIGRRVAVDLPFAGNIFGLVARFGPNLTAEQITMAETILAGKTGVTL